MIFLCLTPTEASLPPIELVTRLREVSIAATSKYAKFQDYLIMAIMAMIISVGDGVVMLLLVVVAMVVMVVVVALV